MQTPNVKSTFDSISFEWDKNESNIENIYNFCTIFLNLTDPHNKISTRILEHNMRTIKIAEKIMTKEIADREIVIISLLMHDIGKTLCDTDHNLISYRIAELLFNKFDVLPTKKKKILDAILYHSAKNLSTLDISDELKVIMDADIIDEVGLLLIAKICLRVSNKNISISSLLSTLDNKYQKVNKETDLLKTKYGKELYCQRKKKLKEDIERLKIESIEYKIKK